MNIFVTGASGFVGGATTAALVRAGHKVRAMSRSAGSDGKIEALGAEPARCDLETVSAEHLKGCAATIHCAAYVEAWGPKDAWFKSNVLGTERVLDAARAAGVRRFVHIGSEAALVRGQHIVNADETYPLAPDSPYPYCATKAEAERRVRAANAEGVFETIVLRPRFIWGPGDTTLLPEILKMAGSGRWSWIDGGAAMTSTTHIDNLVRAILLALSNGRGGAAYFVLDDGTISMRDMITAMAAAKGVALPDRSTPAWLADLAGGIAEGLWWLLNLGGEPPLTRHAAMVMSRTCTLTDALARRELGYAPVVGVKEGLAALAAGPAART